MKIAAGEQTRKHSSIGRRNLDECSGGFNARHVTKKPPRQRRIPFETIMPALPFGLCIQVAVHHCDLIAGHQ